VGKNGSGKSTFFQAIEFVLGDSHSSLASEAREKLLHVIIVSTPIGVC